jgi:hypothetical protein
MADSDIVKGPELLASVPANMDTSLVSVEDTADDRICLAVRDDELPDNILKAVVYGFAEEQASLLSLRKKLAADGKLKDTANICLKRGLILKYMSETLLEKQAMTGTMGEIDLRGPKFREIFKMFLEIISQTFDEVKIPVEFKEMFYHALSKNLEGWENRAERRMKQMAEKVFNG